MRASTGVAALGGVLAVTSGVEVLTHGPLYRLDNRVASHYWPITATRTTHLGQILANVGKPELACLVVGGLGAIMTLLTRRWGPVFAAVVGLGGVGLLTLLLKHVFPHQSVLGGLSGSFPSGHTGVAVATSGLVVWMLLPRHRWRTATALIVAALWGALMAWGRLIIEAHWLSDVIAGWGIGMLVLVLALRSADSRLGTREWDRSALTGR